MDSGILEIERGWVEMSNFVIKSYCVMLLMCDYTADNSFIKQLLYTLLRFQLAFAKHIFWRLKPFIGFKIISMVCWLIGVDRIAAGRWQGWLCFTEDDCGAGFPFLVPVCLCLCQSRLPVLRPWLAWHLSSPWWYTGYSWHPDLLACCWGVP